MKLTRIRVKDFRSFFGEHEFEAASGVNYFVGPNNCGKSNLVRALELALDPDTVYVPERDRPARGPSVGAPPTTRITLTFKVGNTSPESTLLRYARAYEIAVRRSRKAPTGRSVQLYADKREVRIVTSFGPHDTRRTTFQAKGSGAASLPVESDEHRKLEAQFRSVVRFGVIHSGEDLKSLLKGKLRQILELVIADHLRDELADAEAARADYLGALRKKLLFPLEEWVTDHVSTMFPEIQVTTLLPEVPSVSETLSSVDVQLQDAAITQLTDKGTGVRGAVLVSMLQYLAEQSKRSLVMAVEEPEAFLHPAGQELMRNELEVLAERNGVSLIVTTHSPHVISRSGSTLVTELRKGPDGGTFRAASARGDESRAEILGSLYRDAGIVRMLERSAQIPPGTRAVVITEGYTDGLFLRAVCSAVGQADLLNGIHFLPAGKAAKVVVQAILTEAATDLPVIALVDFDDNGRAAADKLKSFGWEPSKRLLSLREWPASCNHHDIEIEDLLPSVAVRALVTKLGESVSLDRKEKCGRGWHYRLSDGGKSEALKLLVNDLPRHNAGGMTWLAQEINSRIKRINDSRASAASSSLAPVVRAPRVRSQAP